MTILQISSEVLLMSTKTKSELTRYLLFIFPASLQHVAAEIHDYTLVATVNQQ